MPSSPLISPIHVIFSEKTQADRGNKVENRSLSRKQTIRILEKFQSRSSRRSASNSNQGSPNTQTLPTITLFLPLQVHGSWLGVIQSSRWKSDFIGNCGTKKNHFWLNKLLWPEPPEFCQKGWICLRGKY